jgi:hypothetical protein
VCEVTWTVSLVIPEAVVFMSKRTGGIFVIVKESTRIVDFDHCRPRRWFEPELSRQTIPMNTKQDGGSTEQLYLFGFVQVLHCGDLHLQMVSRTFPVFKY